MGEEEKDERIEEEKETQKEPEAGRRLEASKPTSGCTGRPRGRPPRPAPT